MVLETPIFRPLYGTSFLLVIAVGLSMLTIGVQIIKSNLMQMGDDLEKASWAAGAYWFQTLRKIIIPLTAPAIIVVGIMGFISAARNIAHLALLSSSDNRPLAILQLEYMMEGRFEAASVIGVMIAGITIVVAMIARWYGFQLGPNMENKQR